MQMAHLVALRLWMTGGVSLMSMVAMSRKILSLVDASLSSRFILGLNLLDVRFLCMFMNVWTCLVDMLLLVGMESMALQSLYYTMRR